MLLVFRASNDILNAMGDVTLTRRDATISLFHADTLSVQNAYLCKTEKKKKLFMVTTNKIQDTRKPKKVKTIISFYLLRFVSDAKRCLKKILTTSMYI